MKIKNILRISLAAALALVIGFSLFTEGASAKPRAASYTMQFRSNGRNDGSILEYAEDAWVGGKINPAGRSIFVGDDSRRRASIGILDFDTSLLPDEAVITGAYLQLRVTSFPTRYGNPYTVLGELYADIYPGYYGDYPKLEVDPTGMYADDFSYVMYDVWDYFSHATRSGDNIFVNLENAWSVDPYERTQVAVYFMFFDDGVHICFDAFGCNNNTDSLSQGLSFASGNHANTNVRPLLTVFYDYP